MAWTYAHASVRGTSHVRAGTRLQDARKCFLVERSNSGQCFCAIVSDGAGSADYGGEGASIVCRTLGERSRASLSLSDALPTDEEIWAWIDEVRDRIHLAASNRESQARQFAATLVMVVATKSEILSIHIGDGAIVARNRETSAWCLISGPQNGEYASTTFFVTDDPAPALRILRQPNQFDALAAFSDGIENLVLDGATHAPAGSFFGPMARPLESATVTGHVESLSKGLAVFLGSDRVNDRTDDDKTLVMAVLR